MFHYYEDLKGIKNKEGKKIREGLLFRGTPLTEFDDKEIDYLRHLPLKTIIDLRHKGEIDKEPDILFENVNYIECSILEANISAATHESSISDQLKKLKDMESMQETYQRMLSDPHCIMALKKVLHTIVKSDSLPVYYHCVTGKDRTGIVTILLLEMLSMERKTIEEVYLSTRKYYIAYSWELYFKTLLVSQSFHLALKAKNMYTVQKEYIDIAYNTIQQQYSNMKSFLTDILEIDEEAIQNFKSRVLE